MLVALHNWWAHGTSSRHEVHELPAFLASFNVWLWPCCSLQVSDKERQAQQDNLFKDVAGILVDKTLNPETSRPYTLTMLERALRDVHFNPDPKKSAKQHALEVCKAGLIVCALSQDAAPKPGCQHVPAWMLAEDARIVLVVLRSCPGSFAMSHIFFWCT
jgi:hypothetical protein